MTLLELSFQKMVVLIQLTRRKNISRPTYISEKEKMKTSKQKLMKIIESEIKRVIREQEEEGDSQFKWSKRTTTDITRRDAIKILRKLIIDGIEKMNLKEGDLLKEAVILMENEVGEEEAAWFNKTYQQARSAERKCLEFLGEWEEGSYDDVEYQSNDIPSD